MARQDVDIGVEGNDGTGDSIRESFRKVNENFQELYAVFGIGGQISLTDLTDTPNTYEGFENNIPVVRSNGSGIDFLELASDNALTGDNDTIGFDYSIEGKLIIRQLVSKLANDFEPTLSGYLNAATQAIANIAPINEETISRFNDTYGTNLSIDQLVIDKAYADRNYQAKEVAGGGLRLGDEPADTSQYILQVDEDGITGDPVISEGYFVITDHGLTEAFNGAPFVYESSDGDDAFGVTTGTTYYIRIQDKDRISLHNSEEDAIESRGEINLANRASPGTYVLTDQAYDPNLAGNWLSNVALPRKSIVRREGDSMTGALNLHDHPGELAGFGLPNGPDDLQAATKLYVDNVTANSLVNLYVSNDGDDRQTFTPSGREGRSPSYAYKTIAAAARKAEELIVAAPYEPGPYMQTATYNGGEEAATVITSGINSTIAGRGDARELIVLNKEFIQKEVTGFIDATYPEFSYDREICQRDIGYILDSVSLDALIGNNANYLSRWAGIRYYSNPSAAKAIGSQRIQTIAGIEYAKSLVVNYILTNTQTPVVYQDRVDQTINLLLSPDSQADNAIAGKFDKVLEIINNGISSAGAVIDGSINYTLNLDNGNFGFVDQANPENTDIIPGKVVRGKNSGAIGRIIDYRTGDSGLSSSSLFDEIEIQLLEPQEFEPGEELEYGNIVRETQITVFIESGIYYEDYPIRVPANVSIKGDEFRRVIIRPKDRISQSRWADTYFYRDREFDGLVLGRSDIGSIGNFVNTGNDPNRAHPGDSTAIVFELNDTDYTSTGFGEDAIFTVEVLGDGSVDISVTNPGKNFRVGDIVTIPDLAIGATGGEDINFSITSVPNGTEYVNPLTGNVDGYFGYHYLRKPGQLKNVGAGSGSTNIGGWETAALALIDNKEFIQEQVVEYILDQTSLTTLDFSVTKCSRDVGLIVDALVQDLRNGGNEFSLEAQGQYYSGAVEAGTEDETVLGIEHIYTLAEEIFANTQPITYGVDLEYPEADLFNGEADPNSWISGNLYRVGDVVYNPIDTGYYRCVLEHTSDGVNLGAAAISAFWEIILGPTETTFNLINSITFAFNEDYNPPLRNDQMDAFLMNDATILRNISVQGHGGFMLVLDPEGQVLTKSPYVQTGSSFSKSINKQTFSGGLFIDAFTGNSAVRVSGKISGNPYRIQVQSLGSQNEPQGLFVRRPETPSSFYIDGRRFQINAVTNYDPDAGTAELILDKNSNDGAGFTGVTSSLASGVDLDDTSTPIPVTLQTAGNRSMLGNDFTQVNDLGYGLVVVNGALSEMVSMFTYYCWTSYYSKNGSEIRSLTGSSCYGEYGLVAEGSDPNEIPDSTILAEDMIQPAKTFAAAVILELDNRVILAQGDQITQDATLASGTVALDTGANGSRTIYLNPVTGSFDTTNNLQITGPITGDSTVTDLGVSPISVDSTGYTNDQESLSIYVYDMKDVPSNRSEFDIYHATRPAFARYEVASAEVTEAFIGKFRNVGTTIPYTYSGAAGNDALFDITKSVNNGYDVIITNSGDDYTVGETFDVDGVELDGLTGVNDASITITETDSGGSITAATITGTISIDDATPAESGRVYKLNFSTSDSQFSTDGLLEEVFFNDYINYRRNQTHIFSDIARPDVLTIRPSTALIFNENPNFVYRTISFLTSNSIGDELPLNTVQAGFDETYDYIRLIIDPSKAQEVALSGSGTTKGGSVGDVVLAIDSLLDANEVFRLNNNERTPEENRPLGWTPNTLTEAPIISWSGKKHFVFNARGVDALGTIVPIAEDNAYIIVDIEDVPGEDINYPVSASGLASPVVLGGEVVTIRAGLQAGALGDVTINISTCRATGHDFLDVGTGGFNQSNYPNVIFGLPREPDQAKEVAERTKGRVFYVSTDQNGIFRVGRFFSVDQGTGTVTFSASIALSDVDGLGFKRGVVITEFSTDSAMTDNATDTVPTEQAVRGYVNRRLGYDVNGTPVSNKLGPGVLAPNGAVPMTDDLNAAGNTITNLKVPESDSDAANKAYVDQGLGAKDTIPDLRDTEINQVEESQLLVATGYKRIILDTDTIAGGPFERGDLFTGNLSGGQGTIVDTYNTTDIEGEITIVIYTPIPGPAISSDPEGVGQDVISVVGGADGLVIDGPLDEWANGVYDDASDITVTTNREVTVVGNTVTDRYTTLNFQLNTNTIVNADVNVNAEIAQSKLNLNAATTRANSTGITQADLGVASFDNAIFASTNGWITIDDGGLPLEKIERITNNTVLGNWSGDSNDGDIDEIPFSTVADQGGALLHTDFTDEIPALDDPGVALLRTGAEQYSFSNVTTTGEVNSIVKTDASGSIQVNSLILGGDTSYEVLSLDTTEVVFKTPAQGEILRSVGNSGTSGNSNPDVNIPGHLNIGSTGVDESILQNQSNFSGESALGVDWIYSAFIEAPGEKGSASTGLAIGANTGKTIVGQIGIVTADSGTSSSVVPFIFSSTGAVPDTDNTYNIGSSTAKYNTVYATLFNGTALEAYYADLAENYLADKSYPPGTVLVFGGDNEVTVTDNKSDHRVAGVVSTEPATLMNSMLEGDTVVPLALQGRVPCQVIGKVSKGDMLVTSAVPGFAIVDNTPNPGTIIGKALENKTDTERGVIEVVVGKH